MKPSLALLLSRPSFTLTAVTSALFGTGEGSIYEFGDLSAVYQESTGVTAGVVGQPNGLALDRSKWMTQGAELWADASVSAVGEASKVSANVYRIYSSAGVNAYVQISSILTVGKAYRVTFTVDSVTTAGGGIQVGDVGAIFTTTGAKSCILVAASANAVIKRVAGATDIQISNVSYKEITGNHVSQATAGSRPVLTNYSGYTAALFDGTNDSLASVIGGGGSTGFFWCGAVRVIGGDGADRTIWSDVGTNTGYRVRLTSGNKLALGAGNGTAYTSATTDDSALAGNTYVLTCWDDGVNLYAQVNRGPVAQVARPVVSAGAAGFSLCKDHDGATSLANIAIFAQVYKKNGGVVDRDRLRAQRYCAARAGVTI